MQPTLHQATPAELKERLAAERAGAAFFVLRDANDAQQIVTLDPSKAPLTIGRGSSANIRLGWDREVSRLHAEVNCVNGHWTLSDDGLSRNGTFVGGEKISGRRRLRDGDTLGVGATKLIFRSPIGALTSETALPTLNSDEGNEVPPVSAAQRRVAVALCRPFGRDGTFASPATNQEIADELVLSVAAVKTQLRALFQRFELETLPQNEKRRRLVERLLNTGVVSEHEL